MPRKDQEQDAVADPARQQQENREGDSAYGDLTDLQKQADEERANPTDDEGNPRPAEAQVALQAELSHRAAGSSEGGGPWPPDLLARHMDPTRATRSVEDAYTSHEEQDKEQS